jgi:hypothetical protein
MQECAIDFCFCCVVDTIVSKFIPTEFLHPDRETKDSFIIRDWTWLNWSRLISDEPGSSGHCQLAVNIS